MKHKKLIVALFSFALLFAPVLNDACMRAYAEIETSAVVLDDKETELNKSVDEAVSNSAEKIKEEVKEIKSPKVKDLEEMTPNSNSELRNKVVSDTNDNIKFTIKKFLMAMAGVVVSSIIIFLILSLMNKINGAKYGKTEQKQNDPPVLEGENDALKVFFDKTK